MKQFKGWKRLKSGWQNGRVCQELREEIADLRKKCHDRRNGPDRFRLKENPACKNNDCPNNFTLLVALYRDGKTETCHFLT